MSDTSSCIIVLHSISSSLVPLIILQSMRHMCSGTCESLCFWQISAFSFHQGLSRDDVRFIFSHLQRIIGRRDMKARSVYLVPLYMDTSLPESGARSFFFQGVLCSSRERNQDLTMIRVKLLIVERTRHLQLMAVLKKTGLPDCNKQHENPPKTLQENFTHKFTFNVNY